MKMESTTAAAVPLSLPVRRRWWASVMDGVRAHGWSGKLFLAKTTLGSVGTLLFWAVTVLRGVMGGSPHLVPPLGVALFIVPVILLQIWFSTALARFRRPARILAILMCAGVALGSIGMLLSDLPPLMKVIAGAELALMAQFLVYFLSPSYSERAAAFHAGES